MTEDLSDDELKVLVEEAERLIANARSILYPHFAEGEQESIWGDFLDFQRCERPDGTFYGIRDGFQCRKGRAVGPRALPKPKAPRRPKATAKPAAPRKPIAPKKPKSTTQGVVGPRESSKAIKSLRGTTRQNLRSAKTGRDLLRSLDNPSKVGRPQRQRPQTLREQLRSAKSGSDLLKALEGKGPTKPTPRKAAKPTAKPQKTDAEKERAKQLKELKAEAEKLAKAERLAKLKAEAERRGRVKAIKTRLAKNLEDLATTSDTALDKAYGYGRSAPGNTFGWQANLMSAAFARRAILKGETDIDKIADAVHKGWNVTANRFVKNPDQFEDTKKLRDSGKLDAKIKQRNELKKKAYSQLDEIEKEKDRVVARALLRKMRGEEVAREAERREQERQPKQEKIVAKKKNDGTAAVKKESEAKDIRAEMAKLAAQFEKEEATAAAKKKAEAKLEKPQKAEEKPKLDRSELTTRRRELRAEVERELKADIKKQSQDPRMKDYLDSLSPAVKQAREQLELKRRIKERMREEKLVPDKDQIREAQKKLSRKDFAPENGKLKVVGLNGKQNTEIENQVNAGLARTRATSKDAEKKIDELMRALERNPIAIGAYNSDPSSSDAKLAQRSNVRGKLTRARADARTIEKAIDKKISSNSKENGWAIMNENTIMLSNAKEVKKINTPKEAAQLMRLAQKGEMAAHWSWSKGSVDATFIHEVGHIMHQRAFKGMTRDAIIKETEKQFKERGVKANSKYGTTNALETVAELYASYVMYGNQMKREMPETYAWIDEMVKRAYAAD